MKSTLIESLRNMLEESSPVKRREILLEHMSDKVRNDFDCSQCAGGWCCTFEYNSMRMTPLEALDMYFYLQDKNRINDDLLLHLKQNQQQYRLDKEIILGRAGELRRTYTCPFFNNEVHGCSIGKNHKPYGCLAFNPIEKQVREAGFCESDQRILAQQQSENETELNQKIVELLKLEWSKKDIPSALISLHEILK